MVKIKTELEQKIELMDSLENVKNVVNGAGGNITEDTPYLQYGEKVLEVIGGGGTPESAKGSFNASTQMLTFNNSYLVEKVNSSIASQEQKDFILQELGDDDVVINMNVDRSEGLPVTLNSWSLGDDKKTPIGGMLVSKTNPVTIKFLFTGDSGLMFLDWSAFAELLSLQGGTTITPEQAEEQYGQYVVDENVCTVSGTLGNFSVEFN